MAKRPIKPKPEPEVANAPKRMGRPTIFSEETAEKLIYRVMFGGADGGGRTLKDVCTDPDMPSAATIFAWQKERPELAESLWFARSIRVDGFIDRMDQMAKDVMDHVNIETPDGIVRVPKVDPKAVTAAVNALRSCAQLIVGRSSYNPRPNPNEAINTQHVEAKPLFDVQSMPPQARDLMRQAMAIMRKHREEK